MEEKKKRIFYLPAVKAACTALLVLAMAAVFIFGSVLVSVIHYCRADFGDLYRGVPFEETAGCGYQMVYEMQDISEGWSRAEYFEKDGRKDMEAWVDIQNFSEGIREESERNKNTSYTLKSLEKMINGEYADIQLQLREALNASEYMSWDYYSQAENVPKDTQLSERFWYLYHAGKALETELPESGVFLADYALQNPDTVSIYALYQQLLNVLDEYQSYVYGSQNVQRESNLRYWVYDKNKNRILSRGFSEELQPETAEAFAKKLKKEGTAPVFWKNMSGWKASNAGIEAKTSCETVLENHFEDYPFCDGEEMVLVTLDTGFAADDNLRGSREQYEQFSPYFMPALIGSGVSLILVLLLLVLVTLQAGRSAKDGELHLTKLELLPTEAAIAAMLVTGLFCMELLVWGVRWTRPGITVVPGILFFAVSVIVLCVYLSLVRRIKARNLWKHSILRFVVKTGKNLYDARKTSGKLMILFVAFALTNMILVGAFAGFGIAVCVILDVLVLLALLKEAVGRQVIKDGLQQITDGNLDYKIPLEGLQGENRRMAESINGLGEGLEAAVEKSMKSERLKADLITNVSHDIKTPLTSIINYVDLLKRENIEEPKIKGYIDILDGKSQRLKQLTEDLVEASKISSGNVKLEFGLMNLKELICQTNGEFAERFAQKELELICRIADEPLVVYADGRRMWRILENLYTNAAKYAMPKTRVYVDAWAENGTVFFVMKNISENTLNINADELTERFIRGDISRSTEGSGLGLSIAKNLTQLQKGNFEIYLDGDLFKVTVSFPQVRGE